MDQDLVTAIRSDHAEIKSLMEQVSGATTDRADSFQRLVTKLATHETAEEAVVRPLARKAPDGDAQVEARLDEESRGKEALARLEKMGADDPAFTAAFEKLRTDVLAHAEHEEQEEHPRLRETVDAERLRRAADLFRKAERIGPTHAHAAPPPDREPPTDDAPSDERLYSTVPLETDEGETVIRQQNVGVDNMAGGGEWPDPKTPPQPPAPGSA